MPESTPMDKNSFLTPRDIEHSGLEPRSRGDLSDAVFEVILKAVDTTMLVGPGDVLIPEGAQDTSLHILGYGEVEVHVPTQKGWVRVATLKGGSVIGEMAFLDGLPRSARVVAKTRCSALRITRESFHEFALREPSAALAFIWELSRTVSMRMRRVERFDAAELAREQERKALAAELHDETMADLGSLVVELGFMQREASAVAPELNANLDEIRNRVKATDRRLRDIVQGIFPPVLEIRGLAPALNSLLSDFSSRPISSPYPLAIEMGTTGFDRDRLPEDIEIGVYRVIQQGVSNVAQHAQAKNLLIDLKPESTDGHGWTA